MASPSASQATRSSRYAHDKFGVRLPQRQWLRRPRSRRDSADDRPSDCTRVHAERVRADAHVTGAGAHPVDRHASRYYRSVPTSLGRLRLSAAFVTVVTLGSLVSRMARQPANILRPLITRVTRSLPRRISSRRRDGTSLRCRPDGRQLVSGAAGHLYGRPYCLLNWIDRSGV
jgi:hypothetical protein